MSEGVALVYVRVSKYDATDRGHKVSPETQLDRCKALTALNGLHVEAFEDLDYSGKDFKRPGFLRLQERLQRGDVRIVACYSLSRLSRSVVKTYGFLEDLQSQGVAFVSATEPIDTSTPMGKAFMGNTAVWSQLERELTSERVRHALAYKKGQGHWVGTLPAGLKRDSAGGIVVDRPVAKTIRLVFEQYATGAHSFRTLAAWLNRRGIKTIATRGGNGRPPAPLWSGDVLKEVLARPAYGGMLQTADGRIAANLPEIVPIRLWGRCEDIRKRQRFIPGTAARPRYRTSPFPLVGLLRCGCGASMRGRRTVWQKQVRRLYVCSDHARYGTCPAPPIKADQLEAAYVEWLSKCRPDDQLEAAARALVERGLRQRRIPTTEWTERRTVRELEGRLARQRWMYDRGDMPQVEYDAVSAEVKPSWPGSRRFRTNPKPSVSGHTDSPIWSRPGPTQTRISVPG